MRASRRRQATGSWLGRADRLGIPGGEASGRHITATFLTSKINEARRIEVVEAEGPRRIVERNVSGAGRRQCHGTYAIEPLPTGGARVSFTYTWVRAPLADRTLAPVLRATLRHANRTVMRRLAAELACHESAAES
ncbi:SRPBCC family protein [Streptomyces sp. NPDC002221]|uniref:SRPBCC family protein n=1 Tax=Streptomyces sp. NPDC002221 TaxID=3364639 RepID=UPI0036ADB673